MELIPEDLRARLLAHGAEVCEKDDHIPLVKLYTPKTDLIWLISEIDPRHPDLAFALCDLGMGRPELGYVSLPQIASAGLHPQLAIRRDLSFNAPFPLSVYALAARRAGRIILEEEVLSAAAQELKRRQQALESKYDNI
jgi:hypothetical protein